MVNVTIVNYGSGNLRSVLRATQTVSEGMNVQLSDDPRHLRNASHIILPGVGAFEACYNQLTQKEKLYRALCDAVRQQGKAFLGICVGMQLMAETSLEYEKTSGLAWIKGQSRRLPNQPQLTIPHMGWNQLNISHHHPLFQPMHQQYVYFAHSFAVENVPAQYVAATCNYGQPFCAAIAKNNMIGTQFHPEKSQQVGLDFLKRFVHWQI